ncbi:TIGR01777 family oxidoreductase [Euzebya tangerina]|uniref:TIGR01777 family oxidoreductase n=1 Tax=Euzebya tangerina TaxID=591198 RepID=UPI000E30BB3E|nr:TIGR01777 family oxidoreductase [Euzebya tangerina]
MKIAITGSTGLIGERLVADLLSDGHQPIRMVRSNPTGSDIVWSTTGPLDPAALRGVDAVVHLAGEPIGAGRWTDARKRRIRESRVNGTTTLTTAMAAADGGPKVLVSASAIGYYGDAGDTVLTESSPPGDDFLADVVVAWEAAADPAREAGIRVCHPRTGIVLDPDGGALQKMLPLFKLGVGGKFGSGEQWWSWITIDDVSGAIRWMLENEDADGAYNLTAPNPTTNAEFTEVLGDVLGRPTFLPVPKFGPKLILGELADALLFHSQRVEPQRTEKDGYTFQFANLAAGLRQVLGK